MAKLESDGQNQARALQDELLSSRATNVELGTRVGELEGQVALLRGQVTEAETREILLQGQLAEVETRLAVLKGGQDATCSEAFDLGAEECRNAISKEHPEWDLSFLDARTPVDVSADEEEDEYIDDSEADPDTALGPGEAAAPEERPPIVPGGMSVFEAGESSRAPEGVAGDSAGADPTSRP